MSFVNTNDIVVYCGCITRYKHIIEYFEMSRGDENIRMATSEEKERYLKLHNEQH